MKESEIRRAAIVKRLLSLDLSTKKELQDIIKLVAVICKTPVAFITLLDDKKQYIRSNIGLDIESTPIEEAFCRYTVLQNEVLEVPNTLLDGRFTNNLLVTGHPNIRFYAGSPLTTQSGDNIGSLCVIDNKPNTLNDEQKQMLQILSRQVTNILEFELSLKLLKEEIAKVQESEIKLKSIFQSSPTAHVLVDKEMNVLAFNKAAADFVLMLNKKIIKEAVPLTAFLSKTSAAKIINHCKTALAGRQTSIEQRITYGINGEYWWSLDFNPVFNHNEDIIGVSLDATNITEKMKAKEEILVQNKVLKEIARLQSHEIRRPVANILGLVDMLEIPAKGDFPLHVQYLKEEVQALDKIIRQVVDRTNTKLK